jgi:two-component system sensor histidine kinase DesK
LASTNDTLGAAGIEVVTSGEWNLDLAPSVENVLALGLREASTNVVRHARARRIEVDLTTENGGAALTVTDDGVGLTGREGSGLRGMRERAVAAGGTVRFGSGPGDRGTRITIEMPFGVGAS